MYKFPVINGITNEKERYDTQETEDITTRGSALNSPILIY